MQVALTTPRRLGRIWSSRQESQRSVWVTGVTSPEWQGPAPTPAAVQARRTRNTTGAAGAASGEESLWPGTCRAPGPGRRFPEEMMRDVAMER